VATGSRSGQLLAVNYRSSTLRCWNSSRKGTTWSIVFTKPGHECVLELQHDDLVITFLYRVERRIPKQEAEVTHAWNASRSNADARRRRRSP